MRLPLPTQRRCLFIITIASAILTLTWLYLPRHSHRTTVVQDPMTLHSRSRLLPFSFWNHRSVYPERYKGSYSCMKFPEMNDLKYAAVSWQWLPIVNGSVYIYGAYWDPRFEEPLVRILVYCDVVPVPKLYCQLWFPNDNEPQTELATPLFGWDRAWDGPTMGVNEPYILTCSCRRHPPEKETAPVAVSVVTAPCGDATNVLDIQNAPFDAEISKRTPPQRNNSSIAVCLKWLHYRSDISASLVEWLQLIKHFGAERVYIYIVRIHPNVRKVLKYYADQGFVVVTEIDHPPQISGLKQSRGSRDFEDYKRELLPLNDCLYRNLFRHSWLLAIDLDEIIVPLPNTTWPYIIESELSNQYMLIDALVFRNYLVLDGAQKDLEGPAKARILSHTWRAIAPSPPGFFEKSFINTSSVIAMHNHLPILCKRECSIVGVSLDGPGTFLHFREKCYDGEDCPELHNVMKEDFLASWRPTVLQEIRHILGVLDLEPLD
ncbi:uncharacterized protein LOC118281119 [Spodoptera frugiperda]|uniref:Glycosyltransferase family 92 protein n=1 Tax=Spodoptera frugiperda TaxID=7108 RepID=A0A9R0DKA9_SPOFR|nr:uncharacterized protein LOC118281119 [Spodoptera frugiperda]